MRINDRCYVLYGLNMIAPWVVNAGFIVGDNTTLIVDCGADYLSAQTVHGYATAAKPSNNLTAINTEPHADHTGGNSFFRELGIDIYGHVGIDRSDEILNEVKDGYNATIPEPYRREQREGDLVFLHTSYVNPNKRFQDNFVLDLGGIEVRVLLTPGHTRENVSVLVPSERTLYCGDLVVNRFVPNLEAGDVADWQTWLQSLNRVAQLSPKVVVPGHGEIMRGTEVERELTRIRGILETAIELGSAPTATE